jgi:hypothetical protein
MTTSRGNTDIELGETGISIPTLSRRVDSFLTRSLQVLSSWRGKIPLKIWNSQKKKEDSKRELQSIYPINYYTKPKNHH